MTLREALLPYDHVWKQDLVTAIEWAIPNLTFLDGVAIGTYSTDKLRFKNSDPKNVTGNVTLKLKVTVVPGCNHHWITGSWAIHFDCLTHVKDPVARVTFDGGFYEFKNAWHQLVIQISVLRREEENEREKIELAWVREQIIAELGE